MLSPLRRLCCVTDMEFVMCVKCPSFHTLNSALYFHLLLGVNALHTLVHSKYEVISTEIYNLATYVSISACTQPLYVLLNIYMHVRAWECSLVIFSWRFFLFFFSAAAKKKRGERRCWKRRCRLVEPKHWTQCSPGAPCWERAPLPEVCGCWSSALTNRQCVTFDLRHTQSEKSPPSSTHPWKSVDKKNVFQSPRGSLSKPKYWPSIFVSNGHLFGVEAVFVFLSSSRAEYGFTPAFKHTHDAGWCQTQIIADIVAISCCRVLPRSCRCFWTQSVA